MKTIVESEEIEVNTETNTMKKCLDFGNDSEDEISQINQDLRALSALCYSAFERSAKNNC